MIVSALTLENCGPIIISSRPDAPPPPWFYPNRVEKVRYVYFPEHMIYYDLSLRNYIYLNNNVWVRVNVLPPQYRTINLNRSRYVRVKDYRGDNIRTYHNENNIRRSSKTSTRSNTTKTRRN
nr:hypothetical protein [uncultured Psychroserpens sp.]